jgi:hypothetical protein
VITSGLYAVFDARRYTVEEIAGLVMIACAVIVIGLLAYRLSDFKQKTPIAVDLNK